jgi:hypothetical protein
MILDLSGKRTTNGQFLPHRSLPRLLYIGDQPVESTMAGAAVPYRLLEQYSPERHASTTTTRVLQQNSFCGGFA